MSIERLYQETKERFERQGLSGLALDVDDTLAETNVFWAQHHIEAFGNPENLTAEQIIGKYRFADRVPYWQCDEAR